MPIDTTIFRDHFRLRERQRAAESDAAPAHAERNSFIATATASLDGPSDTRTRPRHHFRRGAISEASGQPNIPVVAGVQINAQQELRIRSHTINDIEIEIVPSTGRQLPSSIGNPAYQAQVTQWSELVDQIHRGLVNLGTPGVQDRISAMASRLQGLTAVTRNRPNIESSSRGRHRDTHRYGREGWRNVENESEGGERPSIIAGSSFAVPRSTLNLFQSVNLFEPSEPRFTVHDHVLAVALHVESYYQELEGKFNETVAARRSGRELPKGKLFTISMELSRVKQLRSILDREGQQMRQAEREASRRDTSLRRDVWHGGRSVEEGSSNGNLLDTEADEDDSASESGEPEGWPNLDLVLDGDYPQEVCFHVGPQQLTFPIEQVEDWMMDSQRRARRPCYSQIMRHGGHPRPGRESQPAYWARIGILHTLTIPETVRPTWFNHRTMIYDEYDEDNEADEDYYRREEFEEFLNNPESDIPDTEYEEEEEDNEEETDEDLDEEGWADLAPPDARAAEQISAAAGSNVQSLDTNAQVQTIDLTGSPTPPESQSRSQNTSDETTPATVTSSDDENQLEFVAPHPVQDWTIAHSFFMFSCRGSIFDVTRQLQHVFGFQAPISPHMVGERLNGDSAARHRAFILTFLPGETGIAMRASMRQILHQRSVANDDIYHGTQDIVEGNVEAEHYGRPPLPGMAPECWDRTLDICLLQDLNKGRFSFPDFYHRHRATFNSTSFSEDLRGFLGIRLAQVRYLGISESELAVARS